MAPKPDNTIAITCGPPIMIRFVLQSLQKLQFSDEQIYTTLEKRMKCGIGICGRCNLGPKYVCVDGPVFTHGRVAGPAGRDVGEARCGRLPGPGRGPSPVPGPAALRCLVGCPDYHVPCSHPGPLAAVPPSDGAGP